MAPFEALNLISDFFSIRSEFNDVFESEQTKTKFELQFRTMIVDRQPLGPNG